MKKALAVLLLVGLAPLGFAAMAPAGSPVPSATPAPVPAAAPDEVRVQSIPASVTFTAPSKPAPATVPSPPPFLSRFSLLAGANWMFVDGKNLEAPAVSARYALSPRWSLEAGALLPVKDSGFRHDSAALPEGTFEAATRSLYESHISVRYELPHGGLSWVAPEAGLGVSFTAVHDDLTSYGSSDSASSRFTVAPGPLLALGVSFFPKSVVSLRLEAGSVLASDKFENNGQPLDLSLAGWYLRPMVEVRL